MPSNRFRALLTLNGVLLGFLALIALAPGAPAQSGQPRAQGSPGRAPGVYLVVSGRTQGSVTDGIYVLDSTNQELMVLEWDRNGRRLNPRGWRSLAADSAMTGPGR